MAIFDKKTNRRQFAGVPVVRSLEAPAEGEAVVVTDIKDPQAVYDRLTAALSRENEEGLIPLQPRGFEKGEALRIVSGALADCFGFFEQMADRDRVVLLLDLLGRKVRVQAPLEAVSSAG